MEKATTVNRNANSIMDNVQDIAENLKEQGKETFENLKDQGSDLLKEVLNPKTLKNSGKWIQKNPGAAIVAAIGIGLAVYLLARGSQE